MTPTNPAAPPAGSAQVNYSPDVIARVIANEIWSWHVDQANVSDEMRDKAAQLIHAHASALVDAATLELLKLLREAREDARRNLGL